MLVGCEPSEGLEALGEVVGGQEGFELLAALPMGLVAIASDGGFLEDAIHPLDMTVGSRMVGLVSRCSMPYSRQMRSNKCVTFPEVRHQPG